MKKILFSLAAIATLLTSCDSNSKDSYTTVNFGESNLIVDLDNPSEPAQVSSAVYSVTLNYSKDCIDMSTNDLVINNQKVAFETDTMAYRAATLVSQDGMNYINIGMFGKKGNVGKGAEITNLDAMFTGGVYYVTDLYVPEVTSVSYAPLKLVMGYELNNRYRIRTFWNTCFYMGKTYVSGDMVYDTSKTSYRVELNMEKKTARVVVYYPEFSDTEAQKDVPQAIVMEEIPIKFTHDSYYLAAEAPKTRVLGKKDNTIALVDSAKYKATDFRLDITGSDLTEAAISYKIDGKSVSFTGCSIIKASK